MTDKKPGGNRLPQPIKDIGIKWSIGLLGAALRAVRWVYRWSYSAVRYAGRQGVNFDRELPPLISNIVKASRLSGQSTPFGLDDFLLLTAPAAMPEVVRTSIIIPVFNNSELTFQCLRSLLCEIDLSANEIIVVDNASSDETPAMLAQLKDRIRMIRNAENRGFVDACNIGAASARGQFLIFLNNDTIVQQGWLDALVETAEKDESVGAAGSMLIYPHGHLQEAGGIVWNDASAYAYGSKENPDDSRFNFVREVDYCSGASLLVSKELFDRLGGFDMRFAPAYYEDTDLCMSVRAAGYKVVFQPASRVIHHEGATAGTSTQSGFKRFQEINRHKFFDKWRHVLETEHLPPDKKNLRAASNRKKGRRILVFFNQIPKPLEDSGSVRMFAILRELARDERVVLVYIHQRSNDHMYQRQLGDLGIETVWIVDFKRRFAGEQYDVAILCYPNVGNLLISDVRRMFPKAKIVYDTVDVHFIRLQREYELTGKKRFAREAARYKKIEKRLAKEADQVWCVTPDDKNFLQEAVPAASIEVVPNIHTMHGRGKPFAERSGLFFIGSFNHRPNNDAVRYFLDEIFPLVLKELPFVTILIAGSNPPPDIFARNSENVSVLGFVADVSPIFESSRLFVAPLRYGAGMKGKIGQALSHGLPAVTTTVGAEGMNLQDGKEILIADDPAAFAESVVRAYGDEKLWTQLSDSGYSFIEENFSTEVVGNKIVRAIDSLTNRMVKPDA